MSVLLALSSLFLLFIITKPKESQETLEYEGNHYFGTTYISPNLNFDEEKTTIFGKSEYLGSYTIKTLNKKSKRQGANLILLPAACIFYENNSFRNGSE